MRGTLWSVTGASASTAGLSGFTVYRANRENAVMLTVPSGITVTDVRVDGRAQVPISENNQVVLFPQERIAHIAVEWLRAENPVRLQTRQTIVVPSVASPQTNILAVLANDETQSVRQSVRNRSVTMSDLQDVRMTSITSGLRTIQAAEPDETEDSVDGMRLRITEEAPQAALAADGFRKLIDHHISAGGLILQLDRQEQIRISKSVIPEPLTLVSFLTALLVIGPWSISAVGRLRQTSETDAAEKTADNSESQKPKTSTAEIKS